MATMIQQELRAQTPEEELEELYEEEPRRRPWGAIVSVVLALAVIFVGYQWQQASAREHMFRSQANALRADAETLRLRVEEAQHEIEGLHKRAAAATAERQGLVERVATLEKQAQERAAALARASEPRNPARERTRATPVVSKPRR